MSSLLHSIATPALWKAAPLESAPRLCAQKPHHAHALSLCSFLVFKILPHSVYLGSALILPSWNLLCGSPHNTERMMEREVEDGHLGSPWRQHPGCREGAQTLVYSCGLGSRPCPCLSGFGRLKCLPKPPANDRRSPCRSPQGLIPCLWMLPLI